MLSDQKNWTAGILGRLLPDRDDRACAFPPAERVIRLPEVEVILAEAISAAYRKGQEDMRARADEAAIDMQKSASLFATTAECAAYNGACRDSAHAIRALEIKEVPDADAGRAAPKEGGADAAG